MKTLTLKQAAKLLHMSAESLRRKAVRGDVPAKKTGKCGVSIHGNS